MDGRHVQDMRAWSVTCPSDEYGAVDVRLGKTRVLAKATCEVVRPYPDRPAEGQLTIALELTPMAIPTMDTGRLLEEEVLISRALDRAIRRSRALDMESLVIVSNEKVWSVRVDVHVLDHDGGLLDACCVAVVAALLRCRRPDVTVNGEEHPASERKPVALTLHHLPMCLTFSFFDATLEEERFRQGSLTVVLTPHGELCGISKFGGVPISSLVVATCTKLAAVKGAEVMEIVKQAVAGAEETEGNAGGGLLGKKK